MTGAEFRAALKEAGYSQSSFADLMGVHRNRIIARCKALEVEPYWAYALAGLIAVNAAKKIGNISPRSPN
ncbi:helix-turn-helix transcriptional regulator [Caballeronia sp. LP003]|uniref:helix-turn-helix transcriptional regulator n=1 Tax=Caballeronia sp. LP003 TaxID=3038551 RepID=UPI002863C17C|nr:helix-turn-helix transcriptional regulator [Caballeronia sp. LP003]MDR5791752.1 helix-turn-helix transcriptional regulator [Caballeronia sp. LP003]